MRKWMVVLGLLLGTTTAFGQLAEVSITGGKSILRNADLLPDSAREGLPADDWVLGDGFRLAFRLTLNTYEFFGHEVGYAYNRSDLGFANSGMAIHQGFYNFLAYALPEGTAFRPFVTGGVHFNNYVYPGTSATQGSGSTKFGINYGGGIKVRIGTLMGIPMGIRLDVRDYITGKPNFFQGIDPEGKLHQLEASGGVALFF